MSALLGTLLNGRYRLDARIGSGGMSTVYRAFDQTLERCVAVKVMHQEIATDSAQLERFRREARAVAQLSHPHVINVIDAGEDDGRPYIVLQHVDGETLKDRIRRFGRLPVAEAVAYAIEIARALGFAHERGIVHRDVKPQNVLIDPEGTAKVTDFGIARSLDEHGLTGEGRVVGTTDYVSPEQALGHSVTGQSDLYSLGIVLFEMLTGEVPYRGENHVAVAMQHVRRPLPDVQDLRPEVSAALAAVVDRATDKDVRNRYAGARELIADLEDVLAIEVTRAGGTSGEATAVLRTLPEDAQRRLPLRLRHPVRLLIALLAATAVALGGLLVLADQAERGTGTGRDDDTPAELEAVSFGERAARDFDPAGDGREHPEEATFVLDRDPTTTWSTERYRDRLAGKPGVGIWVAARRPEAGRVLEVRSPEAGWDAEIWGAEGEAPDGTPGEDEGWRRLAQATGVSTRERFELDTAGREHQTYLVWITGLPEGQGRVRISDIQLFR
jgi:eukaryotic-like serine/threonine-protein kinase